jgi:hypothetical protein
MTVRPASEEDGNSAVGAAAATALFCLLLAVRLIVTSVARH